MENLGLGCNRVIVDAYAMRDPAAKTCDRTRNSHIA
jgi:glucose-6-phosphate dehydrogenase assembly protein OpcA